MKDFLQSPLGKFLIKAAGLYIIWSIVYYGFILDSAFDGEISTQVAKHSVIILNALGYNSFFDGNSGGARVGFDGQNAVLIGNPCNGLVIYALFAGFIIAYHGPLKHKLWMIPGGILLVYFINILRVAALAINSAYYPGTFELNHKFTYTIIVYAVVFALWMLWVNKFADTPKTENA